MKVKFIIAALFIGTLCFSQTVEERLSVLEMEIEKLKNVNDSLLSNWEIFETSQNIKANNFEIKYVSSKGDKFSKTLVVELLLYNLVESINTSAEGFRVVDENGDEYMPAKVYLGAKQVYSSGWNRKTIYEKTPVKIILRFEKINSDMFYIKKCAFKFNSDSENNRDYQPVSLDGGMISW